MGRPPCCDKIMGVKKGPWMVEEDIVLASYLQEHGPGNWRSVPASTGLARCSKSCRLRWVNYLRPGIRRGGFTPHEDNVIIHLQSLLGNRWATIASYLPRRTDNDIKNYWNTHLSKRLKKQEAMGAIFALPPPPPKSAAFSSSSSSSSYAYSVDNISRLLADFMKASAPQASAPTKSSQSASYADAKPSTVVHVIEANEYPLPPTFDDYCISGTGIAAELINSVDDQQQVSLSSIEKWLIDEAAETMDELTSSDACYSVPMLF